MEVLFRIHFAKIPLSDQAKTGLPALFLQDLRASADWELAVPLLLDRCLAAFLPVFQLDPESDFGHSESAYVSMLGKFDDHFDFHERTKWKRCDLDG